MNPALIAGLIAIFSPFLWAQRVEVDLSACRGMYSVLEDMHKGATRDQTAARLDALLETRPYQVMFRHYNRSWRPNHLPKDVFKRMIPSLQDPGEYKEGENERADSMLPRWKKYYGDLSMYERQLRKLEAADLPNAINQGVAYAQTWLPREWKIPDFYFAVIPNGGSGAFTIDGAQGYDFFQLSPTGAGDVDLEWLVATVAHESHHLGMRVEAPQGLTTAQTMAYRVLALPLSEGMATYFVSGAPPGCGPAFAQARFNSFPPEYVPAWNAHVSEQQAMVTHFADMLDRALAGQLTDEAFNTEMGEYWFKGAIGRGYVLGAQLLAAIYAAQGQEGVFAAIQDPRRLPEAYNASLKSKPDLLRACVPLPERTVSDAAALLSKSERASFLVRDVRLFDGENVIAHRSVLVTNGKIEKIGGSDLHTKGEAEVIDGRGRTLLPGLFDAHVHVGQDVQGSLRQALVLGVTTELDMFNSGERLKQIKQIAAEDPPDVADLRTAGIGATAPGGHPTQMGGDRIPTISKPDEAQAFVDARIAEGSDYIKVIYDDLAGLGERYKVPMLNRATLQAVIAAAHVRHNLVVVHIGTEAQAREAIAAGADGLAHMFKGSAASTDFGKFAASHHIFVIPTLETLYAACKEGDGAQLLADSKLKPFLDAQAQRSLGFGWPFQAESCTGTREAMRELVTAGVPILAGTDAPVPGTAYGASLHGELSALVAAGLSPVQALAAATSVPARIFGMTDRGHVRLGMRADLVLVDGDPTAQISDARNIVAIWKRGIYVKRQPR